MQKFKQIFSIIQIAAIAGALFIAVPVALFYDATTGIKMFTIGFLPIAFPLILATLENYISDEED